MVMAESLVFQLGRRAGRLGRGVRNAVASGDDSGSRFRVAPETPDPAPPWWHGVTTRAGGLSIAVFLSVEGSRKIAGSSSAADRAERGSGALTPGEGRASARCRLRKDRVQKVRLACPQCALFAAKDGQQQPPRSQRVGRSGHFPEAC